MNIVVITNSSSYEQRAKKVAELMSSRGHRVTLIESDFIHREKIKGRPPAAGHIYIDTIPYYKNISVKRLYSHYIFSYKAYERLKSLDVDLIYVLIPANSLAKFMALFKKKHNVKLVFDIIDLWPESLPLKRIKNLWVFKKWGDIRNKNLAAADLVITECRLYQTVLKRYLEGVESRTIYWPKDKDEDVLNHCDDAKNVHICYLGSINNIIDIDFIVKLMEEIKQYKPVHLHIVGDGECRNQFLERLDERDILFTYYGFTYDTEEKRKIFSNCQYGLNIMKDSVCVGITMKSVDYLSAGIPLINNIKGDTWDLINQYKIGYNCNWQNMESVARDIALTDQGDHDIHARTREVFEKLFSEKAFEKAFEKSLLPLLKEESL